MGDTLKETLSQEVHKYIYYEEKDIVILHSDCLEILPLLPEKNIDLVLTDPPYNISYGTDINRQWRPSDIKKQFGSWDIGFEPQIIFNELLKLRTKGFLVFTSSELFGDIYFLLKPSFDYCKYLVWIKTNPSPSIRKVTWRQATELIIHAHNNGAVNFTSQDKMRNTFLYNTCFAESEDHPTQKPIDLIEDLVSKISIEDDLILDPFLGSGTTLVACKNLGRKGIGIEIESRYCEIAKQRLQQEVLFKSDKDVKTEAVSLSLYDKERKEP